MLGVFLHSCVCASSLSRVAANFRARSCPVPGLEASLMPRGQAVLGRGEGELIKKFINKSAWGFIGRQRAPPRGPHGGAEIWGQPGPRREPGKRKGMFQEPCPGCAPSRTESPGAERPVRGAATPSRVRVTEGWRCRCDTGPGGAAGPL